MNEMQTMESTKKWCSFLATRRINSSSSSLMCSKTIKQSMVYTERKYKMYACHYEIRSK